MDKKNIEAIYPLTPVQEGMLYHCIKSPESGFYFQQFSCELSNLKDSKKWQTAWRKVVARHGVLRTFFTWEKRARPLQVVRQTSEIPWLIEDWQQFDTVKIESKWDEFTQQDANQAFILSEAPLARCALVQTGKYRYKFLFSFHHIILDGWSQLIIFDEALAYYNGEDELSIETSPPSFHSFVQWYQKQDHTEALAYWSNLLRGFTAATNITKDEHAGQLGNSSQSLKLQDEQHKALVAQAKNNNLTINSFLLAAMSAMLAMETRRDDLVFGTTLAGRPTQLPGINKTAGLFINTVPMRSKLDGDQVLLTWLKQLQASQVSAFPYAHAPLNDIQNASDLAQGKALFETILVVENLAIKKHSELDSVQVRNRVYDQFSHYQLAILVDVSDGITLYALHQRTLISEQKANQILQVLETLLIQMSLDLQQKVGELQFLSTRNASKCNPLFSEQIVKLKDAYQNVAKYIEKSALERPNNTAVVAYSSRGRESVTYDELNKRANRLAHLLIKRGLAKNKVVAVLLDKSVEALTCFIAVLKTGAAYIPLDPSLPEKRVLSVLSDINEGHHFVIHDSAIPMDLSSLALQALNIDEIEHASSVYSQDNPNISIPLDTLAYIIYTSGSSGKPKGVMIEHKALINSTLARDAYYQEGPTKFLLLSSLATDSSIAGIYWTLFNGGALVLTPRHTEQDMTRLIDIVDKEAITHTLCIPNLYKLVLESSQPTNFKALKTVIVAGEACSATLVNMHQKQLPTVGLYNEYGPSECTVWATAHRLNDLQQGGVVSIGKPIANNVAYTLNRYQVAVPQGVVGELYIGGEGLSRGYFKQDDKTNESFCINPYFDESLPNSAKRLYRTGDLVRVNAAGNLEFVGRADNQIKVRGFRVEPEEIEAVLNKIDGIDDSVAFMQEQVMWDGDIINLSQTLAQIDTNIVKMMFEEVVKTSGADTRHKD